MNNDAKRSSCEALLFFMKDFPHMSNQMVSFIAFQKQFLIQTQFFLAHNFSWFSKLFL